MSKLKSQRLDETQTRNRRNRRKVTAAKKEPVVVKPQVPSDNRVNLNNLTAEGLTQVLPGVGIKTAKEIIELRQGFLVNVFLSSIN